MTEQVILTSICPSCGATDKLLWPEGCNNVWHREGVKIVMYTLCQEIIWTSTDKANTYCMRERGHTGKHNVINEEPVEAKEANDRPSNK